MERMDIETRQEGKKYQTRTKDVINKISWNL